MVRILVLDNHAVYRSGFRELIRAKISRSEVIEADSLTQALRQIRNRTIDLVLAGVDPSSFGSLDPLKEVREASPATRIAIISTSGMRSDILAILAAGFHGFILRHQSDTDILAAIRHLLSGRIYVPRSLAEAGNGDNLGRQFSGDTLPALSTEARGFKLTKRQREVLSLLVHGKSNKEISRALKIAEATTKIHIGALLRALGVRNRTEAAYRAGSLVDFAELGVQSQCMMVQIQAPSTRMGHEAGSLRERQHDAGGPSGDTA